MRLSRTDLIPVLAIVAGGVLGASLSFSFRGASPADDAPAPDPVLRIEVNGYPVVTAASIEVNGMVVTPVVAPSVTPELRIRTESSDGAVLMSVSLAYNGMVITPVMRPQPTPDPVVAPSATAEALRLEELKAVARMYVFEQREAAAESALDRLEEVQRLRDQQERVAEEIERTRKEFCQQLVDAGRAEPGTCP